MSLKISPITPGFAAEATGIELREMLSPQDIDAIIQAMNTCAVLVFRDQAMSQLQQIAFARQLGPLDTALKEIMQHIQTRLDYDELTDISNVDLSGKVAPREHRQAMMNLGNMLWHTDSSFMEYGWRYSMLSAVKVVSWGGQTEWADLRAAYDALDTRTKALIENLVGEHFALFSRTVLGFNDISDQERAIFPPVHRPLVHIHAGSGRKVLFVTNAIQEILGLTIPEGRVLVSELLEHATQPRFVYSHLWRENDFVIWDNRAVIHRGRRFDMTERREMRRVATVDDVRALAVIRPAQTPA